MNKFVYSRRNPYIYSWRLRKVKSTKVPHCQVDPWFGFIGKIPGNLQGQEEESAHQSMCMVRSGNSGITSASNQTSMNWLGQKSWESQLSSPHVSYEKSQTKLLPRGVSSGILIAHKIKHRSVGHRLEYQSRSERLPGNPGICRFWWLRSACENQFRAEPMDCSTAI